MTEEQASAFGVTLFIWVVGAIAALFALMLLLSLVGWILSRQKATPALCPYTGVPLHRGEELFYISQESLYEFLADCPGYDNPQIDVARALVCRDTGRIFPDCISFWGKSELNWSFLRKRHKGNWVSWGSLSKDHQREIAEVHQSLEGFQTEFSSPKMHPKEIAPEYVFEKPGPLYVDIETKELLGWKEVPGSQLEVLIVQKPKPKVKITSKKKKKHDK